MHGRNIYDHYLNFWGNKQIVKSGGKRNTSLPSVNQPRPSKSLRFAAFPLLPSHRSQSLHALKNLTLLPPSLPQLLLWRRHDWLTHCHDEKVRQCQKTCPCPCYGRYFHTSYIHHVFTPAQGFLTKLIMIWYDEVVTNRKKHFLFKWFHLNQGMKKMSINVAGL